MRPTTLAAILLVLAAALPAADGNVLSVSGSQLLFNGQPIKLRGLRLSNAIMSDAEVDEVIANLPVFRSYGINAFSAFMMGSRFGDIAGFRPDCTLDPVYAARMKRLIDASDQQGMAMIVGCLYWSTSTANDALGQWGQAQANLACANLATFITTTGRRNIILDPDNEGMSPWDVGGMIAAGKAAAPGLLFGYNASGTPSANCDLSMHFGAKVSGKPWLESEGVPSNAPGGYWGSYSKQSGYYNYINIGVYSADMKANQISITDSTLANHAGYFMASTWLQCVPPYGPNHTPGGTGSSADPGIRWWLDHVKAKYGSWPPTAAAGSVQFTATTASVTEGGAAAVSLQVSRTGGSSGAITVAWTTGGGTATAGSDYVAASGTLSWAAGETTAKTIAITILDDATTEPAETVAVTLSTPTGGATLGTARTATVTIADNDGTAAPSVSRLMLYDTTTAQAIGQLTAATVIDLAVTPKVTIVAEVGAGTGCVRFGLDGAGSYRTENNPPYSLFGDTVGAAGVTYSAWPSPTVGSHTVTATASSADNFTGLIGQPLSVTFTVRTGTPPPPPAQIRICFQPASAPAVSGWLVDAGLPWAARNGQTYGWSRDISGTARDRNLITDQLLDTLVHTQLSAPAATWEIAVPNGTYDVRLVAGDPGYSNSVYGFTLEGAVALAGTPTSANRFVDTTTTVAVADGRLSLGNAAGASNNKLCLIEIIPIPTGVN